MAIGSAVAIYFIIWWTVLFAVLPWGVRRQDEAGEIVPGSDPGAPALPYLAWKLLWTSIIAGVVFALFYVTYQYRLISLDQLGTWFGLLPP